MRYSATTRLVNLVVFAALSVAFGFLGIYFGFLVAPFIWSGITGPLGVKDVAWGLAALLGTLGLTGLLVSLYGLVQSVLAFVKGDDARVRKGFSAYIALGYVAAIFFLFNALWLYRLTSTNMGYGDVGFVIVVYLVLFLITIIVSNIPLLRMYGESEELNKIMRVIVGPILAASFSLLLIYGISFFVLNGSGDLYQKSVGLTEYGVGALFFLVTFLLSGAAFLGYGKADKANVIKKSNGFLFEGSLLVLGGAIITSGIIEYVNQSAKKATAPSLLVRAAVSTNGNYLDFAVMGWILGGVIVLLAFFLLFSTLKGNAKKR